jgi:hypothetical protein
MSPVVADCFHTNTFPFVWGARYTPQADLSTFNDLNPVVFNPLFALAIYWGYQNIYVSESGANVFNNHIDGHLLDVHLCNHPLFEWLDLHGMFHCQFHAPPFALQCIAGSM